MDFPMTKPKVSVLIPVYNAAPYLFDTINAVLAQEFKDFELILLNDASSDNSEEIIRQFKDPRIRYLKNNTNLGISASRNKLMDLARGKYLAVLDNDDICLPQRLKIQSKYLDTHPNVSAVGSRFELFTSNQKMPLIKKLIINLGWVWCHPHTPTLYDALKGNVLMHPTAMYRKADLIRYNIRYQKEYTPAEDYDLIKQMLFQNLKITNLPHILLKYNLHGENCSQKQKVLMQAADKQIKAEIANHLHLINYMPSPYWKTILQKLRLKYFMKGSRL